MSKMYKKEEIWKNMSNRVFTVIHTKIPEKGGKNVKNEKLSTLSTPKHMFLGDYSGKRQTDVLGKNYKKNILSKKNENIIDI